MHPSLKTALLAVRRVALDLVALPFWLTGSPATVHRRVFAFARRVAPVLERVRLRRPRGALPVATLLTNALFCRVARHRPGFPVETRVRAGPLPDAPRRRGEGLLVATVHSQMALAAHGALRRDGRPPLFVGFATGGVTGWNWGHPDPLESLEASDPTLFIKARAALRQGRTVICFVDYEAPAPARRDATLISPNLFAWADQAGVPVVHMFAWMEPDGGIAIDLAAEPEGLAGPQARAAAFVAFLAGRWDRSFRICRPKHSLRGPRRFADSTSEHIENIKRHRVRIGQGQAWDARQPRPRAAIGIGGKRTRRRFS